jgi:hypothetical protein
MAANASAPYPKDHHRRRLAQAVGLADDLGDLFAKPSVDRKRHREASLPEMGV